jgi:hypothetical protein
MERSRKLHELPMAEQSILIEEAAGMYRMISSHRSMTHADIPEGVQVIVMDCPDKATAVHEALANLFGGE